MESGVGGAAGNQGFERGGGEKQQHQEQEQQTSPPPQQQQQQQTLTTIKWKPDQKCLDTLLTMGIEKKLAIKGLYYTGNYSAEFAASYIFDHPELDDDLDYLRISTDVQQPMRSTRTFDSDDENATTATTASETPHFKMVFVVNSALNMDASKVAVQVGHASVGLYRRLHNYGKSFGNQLALWEEEGESKFIVIGEDEPHLMQLDKQAMALDLETYIVRDTDDIDITQEEPVALLGIFGREDIVDNVVGKLQSM